MAMQPLNLSGVHYAISRQGERNHRSPGQRQKLNPLFSLENDSEYKTILWVSKIVQNDRNSDCHPAASSETAWIWSMSSSNCPYFPISKDRLNYTAISQTRGLPITMLQGVSWAAFYFLYIIFLFFHAGLCLMVEPGGVSVRYYHPTSHQTRVV